VSYFGRNVRKGDLPGHPFRGNQYVDASGAEIAALYARAQALAEPHLSRKIRDGGETGWTHSMRVAAQFEDPTLKVIAYLHDLVEDSPITLAEVRSQFGDRVAAAVDALTKRKEGGQKEPLEHYLARVVTNQDALRVKVADMSDNMFNVSAAALASPHLQAKHRQYREVLPRLQQALNGGVA
jgi:(p)ppGpp synthase/HD superfamily hydrolase